MNNKINYVCQSTGELVYTELLNSPAQIPETFSNNFICENSQSQSSESQLLVKYFLRSGEYTPTVDS